MAKCPLYDVVRLKFQRNEIGSSGPREMHADVPVCDHKHSPAPRHIAPKVIGGGDLLKCGGDLDKCQVPLDVRGDVR
jgi:hypothetical protein